MNRRIVALVIAIALIAVASLSLFTVQESEQVVVQQFGKVVRTVTAPGLHAKLPFIEDLYRFPKLWLEWDGDPNQVTTLDKRYIYIDVFARWRIADSVKFIETVRDIQSAQARLDDVLDNATRNVVANHNIIELIRSTNRQFAETEEEKLLTAAGGEAIAAPVVEPVAVATEPPAKIDTDTDSSTDSGAPPSTEPAVAAAAQEGAQAAEKVRDTQNDLAPPGLSANYHIEVGREGLTALILSKAADKAAQFGIELRDVQFKRIDYVESVQTKVFDRMISERSRVAEAYRSQGQGRAAEILGRMEKDLLRIRSEAFRTAEEIRGKADGEAAAIYSKSYQKNPEFYQFLKTLESYHAIMDEDTLLLLSTEADIAKYLENMNGGAP
ncbi:MAG: protease modulator HflC [Myxococcota bacterium]|jgi:membrane protease subunit HflC|nr:protease modulator HflC [Myxococcota bacterium]